MSKIKLYQQIVLQAKNLDWQQKLILVANFDRTTFSTSFSLEDQIITDFIARNNLAISIFTIDTGRLFNETYEVWQKTLDKYKISINTYYPNHQEISNFVTKNGVNSFYHSQEFRLNCCDIRKVRPLKIALKNQNIWISGIRAEHSNLRSMKNDLEYDEASDLIKFYPLFNFDNSQIQSYLKKYEVPYNKLYDQGFESIGCKPCTIAGRGRSGRWWWENDKFTHKECGIHANNRILNKNA